MRNVYIAKHLRLWVISERHFSLLGLLGPFYRFLFTTFFFLGKKRERESSPFNYVLPHLIAPIMTLPLPSSLHTQKELAVTTTVQLNFTQKTVVCEAWKMEK
jgi:hypothetical protein